MTRWVLAGGAVLLAGCVVAAAGAGAGGGIYLTDRGVESLVPATVDGAAAATQKAFQQLKVTETKSSTQQTDAGEQRELAGSAVGRDVTVTLKPEGKSSTHVTVVAKTSAVTWDKDFARAILDKIVAYSR
jgi:Protein of unknown function (DUF3568)